jgi:hypothetical protein
MKEIKFIITVYVEEEGHLHIDRGFAEDLLLPAVEEIIENSGYPIEEASLKIAAANIL